MQLDVVLLAWFRRRPWFSGLWVRPVGAVDGPAWTQLSLGESRAWKVWRLAHQTTGFSSKTDDWMDLENNNRWTVWWLFTLSFSLCSFLSLGVHPIAPDHRNDEYELFWLGFYGVLSVPCLIVDNLHRLFPVMWPCLATKSLEFMIANKGFNYLLEVMRKTETENEACLFTLTHPSFGQTFAPSVCPCVCSCCLSSLFSEVNQALARLRTRRRSFSTWPTLPPRTKDAKTTTFLWEPHCLHYSYSVHGQVHGPQFFLSSPLEYIPFELSSVFVNHLCTSLL